MSYRRDSTVYFRFFSIREVGSLIVGSRVLRGNTVVGVKPSKVMFIYMIGYDDSVFYDDNFERISLMFAFLKTSFSSSKRLNVDARLWMFRGEIAEIIYSRGEGGREGCSSPL